MNKLNYFLIGIFSLFFIFSTVVIAQEAETQVQEEVEVVEEVVVEDEVPEEVIEEEEETEESIDSTQDTSEDVETTSEAEEVEDTPEEGSEESEESTEEEASENEEEEIIVEPFSQEDGFELVSKSNAVVYAHKIVCESEEFLPNWGEGGDNITSTTASDFVDESEGSCWFEEGWEFEWAPNGSTDPGDTLIGSAGGDWTTFGPTDSDGEAYVEFEATGDRLWFREVLKDGYIPFTHDSNGKTNIDDVSAEFYCHTDVLNYDNRDWINGVKENEEYYCIAFNVEEEPDHSCKFGQELLLNGGFEDPKIKSDWKHFPNGKPGFEWVVEWIKPMKVAPRFEIQKSVSGWLPFEGEQYAELDTHGAKKKKASISIAQELETDPGEDYTISFAFSPRPGTNSSDNILKVYWGDTLLDTISADGSLNSQTDWTEYSYEVQADDFFTEFKLADAGKPNTLGTFVDDVSVTCGVEDDPSEKYPYGEITYPVNDYDIESGLITLMAKYYDGDDENDDIVQWAVRAGTCSASTNTVAGNVDGFSDSYNWDGMNFDADLDTDSLTPGNYCFVFNPKDDGETDVRETRWFTVEEDTNGGGNDEPTDSQDEEEDGETTSGSVANPNPSNGEVLGAFTGGGTCGIYLNDYMQQGEDNDFIEVLKLQVFLNEQGFEVPVTGIFGPETDTAVKSFQIAHKGEVLLPWVQYGLGDGETPTGYVYKTTRYKINNIVCPGSEAFPILP
jgi:peptidoglycan hydrolase-like protein with peptidoglycan-binding domain